MDVARWHHAAATFKHERQVRHCAGGDRLGHSHAVIDFHWHLITAGFGIQLRNRDHVGGGQQPGQLRVGDHGHTSNIEFFPLRAGEIIRATQDGEARASKFTDGLGESVRTPNALSPSPPRAPAPRPAPRSRPRRPKSSASGRARPCLDAKLLRPPALVAVRRTRPERQRGPSTASRPRPALAPKHAVLALPPNDRVKHAGLDRPQHLRHKAEQPHVRRAITRRPVPVQFGHTSLCEHIEPQPHVVAVRERAEPDRVAVDRELERGLHLEVCILPGRSLEIDHHEAVGVALEEIERPDEVAVEELSRVLVDQRDDERLLDGQHLSARLELPASRSPGADDAGRELVEPRAGQTDEDVRGARRRSHAGARRDTPDASHVAQDGGAAARVGDPEWLFPNEDGKPADESRVRKIFKRALRTARLPEFRFYDLRHTYASLLLAAGAPITYVSAQLGHANASTTLRYYAKWIPSKGRRWADLLDRLPERRTEAV